MLHRFGVFEHEKYNFRIFHDQIPQMSDFHTICSSTLTVKWVNTTHLIIIHPSKENDNFQKVHHLLRHFFLVMFFRGLVLDQYWLKSPKNSMEARTRPKEQKNIFEKFGQHDGAKFRIDSRNFWNFYPLKYRSRSRKRLPKFLIFLWML